MKTLVLLLLTISCLQPREQVCREDSRLCDDTNHSNGNNQPSIDDRPIFDDDDYEPSPYYNPDSTDNTDNPDTVGNNPNDDSSNTDDTTDNSGGGGVITVNQLTADTKLSDITIEGSCTSAGCLHAESGKKFKLRCELWSSCLSNFKPEIRTTEGINGASASALCRHSGLKVSDLTRHSKLKCSFEEERWGFNPKTSGSLTINAEVITNKYICVYNNRQSKDLYVSTRTGICNQNKTALQLEFKW